MNTLFKILFTSIVFLNVYPQVGINTITPDQTLDVNGKVKIADDLTAPSSGTIRYSDADDDFEGYANGEWKSFTNKSNVPTNAQFVTSRVGGPDDGISVLMPFEDESGNTIISTTVPNGKFLLITHINISILLLTENNAGLGVFPVYRLRFDFGDNNNDYDIFGRYFGGPIFKESAGYSPLAVVAGGEDVRFSNFGAPGNLDGIGDVFVYVAGFLVDDLDFD